MKRSPEEDPQACEHRKVDRRQREQKTGERRESIEHVQSLRESHRPVEARLVLGSRLNQRRNWTLSRALLIALRFLNGFGI